jgi:hypothetical protein
VTFRFFDEANERVEIETGSGWTAKGGGWPKKVPSPLGR